MIEKCIVCKGTGKNINIPGNHKCLTCNGRGQLIVLKCSVCNGTGGKMPTRGKNRKKILCWACAGIGYNRKRF